MVVQYLYTNDTEMSFPNSKLPAINIAEIGAPINKLPIPDTEKNPAQRAMKIAVNNIEYLNIITS